jgi:UPF0716 protein FxsA
MALLLFVIFIVAPLVELAVIVKVATVIGVFNTLGLLIVVSLLGAWVAKHEGVGVLRRVQAVLDRGEVPAREVADGGLILLAAALMIAPGFVSDVLALVLLFPPTRALVRGPMMAVAARQGRLTVVSRFGGRRAPGDGGRRPGTDDVWDVESWEEPTRSPIRGELEDRP